jgi:DNA-binding transcriptional MerR regulator
MSAQPARAYLGIGEVLARLRGEFPDVSVSKIRFLESEGLIEPARSPSGYRRFDEADVERLRYILIAQRDQYLPLRVIKERLPPHPDGTAGAGTPSGPLSRRELLAAAGIDDQQLDELENFGLVRRTGRAYGPDAVQVASAAAVLGRYGVEARRGTCGPSGPRWSVRCRSSSRWSRPRCGSATRMPGGRPDARPGR